MSEKATAAKEQAAEPKQSLPAGHPQAGYVSPDLSLLDGRGPWEEPEAEDRPLTREENIAAREGEVKAVAEAEDKVAKEEAKAAEEEAKAREKAAVSA